MDFMCFTLILSLFIAVIAEPCKEYSEINDWMRSVYNGAGNRCDSMLSEGWYRITSKAGELMPTSCIPLGGKCETAYTLWLNGSYPSVGETANVTVCASDTVSSDCCIKSYEIKIKNCDAYYVYYLVPVVGCPQAYCFGTEQPCPEGYTSMNGFSPGCEFDPCTYYDEIDDWKRSVANGGGDYCDSLLSDGWYRIKSQAGELMPTSCIPFGGRCETAYSMWLNGTYPSVGETANVTVCASDVVSSNCCINSYDIEIKNCEAYYVYHLVPVNGCPQAYCFGSEIPCPEGQISSTGYSPGCEVDPCLTGNHKEFDDYKRSVRYAFGGDKCDNYLEPGWYRPVSKAGYTMPTKCPRDSPSCGTTFPIWMNGTHPQQGNTKFVKACTSVFSEGECCKKSYDMEVKNCGSFYVYYLERTSSCNSRYCFGSEIPCKENEVSDNGFTPGCKPGHRTTVQPDTEPSHHTPIAIVRENDYAPLIIGIGVPIVVLLVAIIVIMMIRRRSKQDINSDMADDNPPTYKESIKGCQKSTISISKA